MSRPSSSQTDFAEVEMSLRRIAEMVGNCIGRKFAVRTYSFLKPAITEDDRHSLI